MPQTPPTVASMLSIDRRAADRLRSGHLWIYRSDLRSDSRTNLRSDSRSNSSGPAPEAARGALLTVTDGRGVALGTALYSSTSQIAARLVSPTAGLTRAQYLEDVRHRVRAALDRRRLLASVTAGDNAHRLLFSEADGLPGIVADRYNDLVLLQLLTQGTAQDDVRAVLVDSFRKEFGSQPLTVWERPDPRIRELEDLGDPPAGALYASADARLTTEFSLNGLRFGYDASAGQKTGAFLDQRLNYAAAAGWISRSGRRQKALDICTYQGGFALHLAQVCERVTGRGRQPRRARNRRRQPGAQPRPARRHRLDGSRRLRPAARLRRAGQGRRSKPFRRHRA